jgi:hypothetical protein
MKHDERTESIAKRLVEGIKQVVYQSMPGNTSASRKLVNTRSVYEQKWAEQLLVF